MLRGVLIWIIGASDGIGAALAREWEARGTRLINPGFVDTRLARRNDFTMPALHAPEAAARAIIDVLNRRGFEVHFPRRLTDPLEILRVLPYWAAQPLTRRVARSESAS